MKKLHRKGKGLIKSVRLMLSVIITVLGLSSTLYACAEPIQYLPDGSAWTIDRELPAHDHNDYASLLNLQKQVWYETGTEVLTGVPRTEITLATGQHFYDIKRLDIIPVYKWIVTHEPGSCIHPGQVTPFHGMVTSGTKCGMPYWSGWAPECADCGRMITYGQHYMHKDDAATVKELDLTKDYYFLCPHPECHEDLGEVPKMEQGMDYEAHVCIDVSWNRYKVVYEPNAENMHTGKMEESFHMYNNETTFEGNTVTPVNHLSKNQYSRFGYVFDSWNTSPDGSGTSYEDGAEIFNLSLDNYDKETSDETGKGIVTLYAQWKPRTSTLIIDAAGGVYNDSEGVWNGANTTRTYADVKYGTKKELKEENITAPKGCTVSFDAKGGSTPGNIIGTKKFNSWVKSNPFHGKFQDNTYFFAGTHGSVDTLTATYTPEVITLPSTEREGYNFGGWYEDDTYTKFIGYDGDTYLPQTDVTLYAYWADLTLNAEAVPDMAGTNGKGGAHLKWEQLDKTNKVFELYRKGTGENESAYVEVELSNIDPLDLNIDKTAVFKNQVQSYTIPYTGYYTIEAYGAQGGAYTGAVSYEGGKGGYVSGKFWLLKDDIITIYTGGAGSSSGIGGYNGGGKGTAGAGGGGCTTVSSNNLGTLLMAGGGGGASPAGNGGAGGDGELGEEASGNINLLTSLTNHVGGQGITGGGAGFYGGVAGSHETHNHVTAGCDYHEHDSSCEVPAVCGGKRNYEEYQKDTYRGDIYADGSGWIWCVQCNSSSYITQYSAEHGGAVEPNNCSGGHPIWGHKATCSVCGATEDYGESSHQFNADKNADKKCQKSVEGNGYGCAYADSPEGWQCGMNEGDVIPGSYTV